MLRLSCRFAAPCVALVLGCGARTDLVPFDNEPQDAGNEASADANADAPSPDAGVDASLDAPSDVVVTSACPAAPPDLGADCGVPGQVCAYATGKVGPCDDVGLDDRVAWRCEDGAWLEIARCVDWGDCPGDPPAAGDPCLIATTGLDCFYSSDDVCAASSIAQCDGVRWQHVNACPARSVPSGFVLISSGPAGELTAVTHPEQQLAYPAMALAGTQMLMTYSLSAGYLPDHGIYGHLVQTAAPKQASLFTPTPSELLGIDAISNPRVTNLAGRFMMAWAANDGWPVHTDGVPGTYVRTVPLHEPPYSSPLVDEAGSAPTSLAMQPDGGRIAYRFPAPSDPSRYAAAVVVLSDSGEPAPLTKVTLADETVSEWFAPPVPNAFVRVEPWREGFVYAYPATASGDLWDDSGLIFSFFSTVDYVEEPQTVRVTVGMPRRANIATLADGSVVAAYVSEVEYGPLFRLVRVWADGSWEELLDPPQPGVEETLGSGPVVAPFEDGFAVAWTSMPIESPSAMGWPRVLVRTGAELSNEVMWGGDVVQGLTPSDAIALAYGRVDRTLHLAWSRDTTGLATLDRQRLVLRPY